VLRVGFQRGHFLAGKHVDISSSETLASVDATITRPIPRNRIPV
jgi:hypothetical protein